MSYVDVFSRSSFTRDPISGQETKIGDAAGAFYEIEPATVLFVNNHATGEITIKPLVSRDKQIIAYPLNSNFNIIPMPGELVLFRSYKVPQVSPLEKTFYESFPYSHSPHSNLQDITKNFFSPVLPKDFIVSKIAGVPFEKFVGFSSEYFKYDENKDRPLLKLEGDVVFEGRSLQSIRFGSSIPRSVNFKDKSLLSGIDWPFSATNDKGGNPYILISNGKSDNIYGLAIENIYNDPAVLFMTSGGDQGAKFAFPISSIQTISKNIKLKNYYNLSTILLNSDELILNSRVGDIILSAKKNIAISSSNEMVLSTVNLFEVKSSKINLGENANIDGESVVKGDSLIDALIELIDAVLSIKYNNYGTIIPGTDQKLKIVKFKLNSYKQYKTGFLSKTTHTL